MLVKFFKHGSNSAKSAVSYLLDKRVSAGTARVLSGNPALTVELTESSTYAKKYTSGCLSFEEQDIEEGVKRQLMQEFEHALFADADIRFDILWVEHTDKNRLELNFVIPNLELETGRRLQPYYHALDKNRLEAWRDMVNIEHGFSRPDDPSKVQATKLASNLPRKVEQKRKAINLHVEKWVREGMVNCRDDVIDALKAGGFEMGRITKNYISVKNPGGGRNIKLEGLFYESRFTDASEVGRGIAEAKRDFDQSAQEHYQEARSEFRRLTEIKRRELSETYRRAKRALLDRQRQDAERAQRLEKVNAGSIAIAATSSFGVSHAAAENDADLHAVKSKRSAKLPDDSDRNASRGTIEKRNQESEAREIAHYEQIRARADRYIRDAGALHRVTNEIIRGAAESSERTAGNIKQTIDAAREAADSSARADSFIGQSIERAKSVFGRVAGRLAEVADKIKAAVRHIDI